MDDSECDTANLYNTGKVLVQQLEKVLGELKQKMASSEDVHSQPKPLGEALRDADAIGSSNASNVELMEAAFTRSQVYMEPSELRLQIKLETWMSADGCVVIHPSLLQSPGAASATGDACCVSELSKFPTDEPRLQPTELEDFGVPVQDFGNSNSDSQHGDSRVGRGSIDAQAGASSGGHRQRNRQRQTNNHHGTAGQSAAFDPADGETDQSSDSHHRCYQQPRPKAHRQRQQRGRPAGRPSNRD